MTDWTTTEQGDSCTASGCMRAGNDLVMPGCFGDHNNLKKELEEKRIELEHVRGEMEELQRQLDKANKDLEDLLKA